MKLAVLLAAECKHFRDCATNEGIRVRVLRWAAGQGGAWGRREEVRGEEKT